MNDNLREVIEQDNSLKKDPDRRVLFLSYANLFEDEFTENIDLSSIELDDKYLTNNPSSWRRFLNHPPVKQYIKGFVDERSEKIADRSLGQDMIYKTTDALKVKKRIDEQKNEQDNSNIVVLFLPQKNYGL